MGLDQKDLGPLESSTEDGGFCTPHFLCPTAGCRFSAAHKLEIHS